ARPAAADLAPTSAPGERAGRAGGRAFRRAGAHDPLRGRAVIQLRIERRMVLKIPWGLVGVTLAIALLGIWNLASASRPPHTPLWARQLLTLGVGLTAGVVIALMDYRFVQRMAWSIYGLNALALAGLRFVGHRGQGEGSWGAPGAPP